MACDNEKDPNQISTINKWLSAIYFVENKINPVPGVITGQFAICTQSAASSVAIANGDGTAVTAFPGVTINSHDQGNLASESATDTGFWGRYANNFMALNNYRLQ